MAQGRKLDSYAQTGVTPGRSHEQIERLLQRLGVDAFRWTTEGEREGLEFRWPRPDRPPAAFRLIVYFNSERQRAQLLRALYWYLKAKVEAIEFGLVDIEQEFFPQMLIPGGQTVFEAIKDDGLARLISPDIIALPEGRPDAS